MNDYIFKFIWIIAGIIMIRFYAKRKSTVKSALIGMVSGGAALIILHYYGHYIGVSPPVNLFNTVVSLVLGIPGAALIAAIDLVFK